MRDLTTNHDRQNFQIRLQREDSLETCECLRMEAQGAVFKSSMPLGFMADLIIRIECPALNCECRAMTVEGIVVGCEEAPDGGFEITVHFLQEENFEGGETPEWGGVAAVNPLLN